MALVKLDAAGGPVPSREAGSLFYSASGKTVLRSVVTPVRPGTAPQQLEAAAVANAPKRFIVDLTPAEQLAWSAVELFGVSGIWLWAYFCSVWQWIFQAWPNVLPPAVAIDPASFVGVTLDSASGSLMCELTNGSGPTDSSFYLAMSPPRSVGRTARPEDCVSVVVGVVADEVFELGPAYLERFGRFPVDGQSLGVLFRTASPSASSISDVVVVAVRVVDGGGSPWATCVPDVVTVEAFGSGSVSVNAHADGEVAWSVSSPGAGGPQYVGGGFFLDGVGEVGELADFDGLAGTFDVLLTFIGAVTGLVLEVHATVVVEA